MADMEADPRFAVHTTCFLSDGAGEEYRGGRLYGPPSVQFEPASQDPSGCNALMGHGRVVSTGGLENRRCRLPTAGVQERLCKIWWVDKKAELTSTRLR
jgi:hypothetical protein